MQQVHFLFCYTAARLEFSNMIYLNELFESINIVLPPTKSKVIIFRIQSKVCKFVAENNYETNIGALKIMDSNGG